MTTFVRPDGPQPARARTCTVRMRCCSLVCSRLGNYRALLQSLVPHYLRFLSLLCASCATPFLSLGAVWASVPAWRRGGLNVASARVGHDAEARAGLDNATHRC